MERTVERLGVLAGMVASLSVGVPVLLGQLGSDRSFPGGPPWLWWGCYLLFLTAFALPERAPARVPWLTERRLLAVQGTAGGAAVLLAPGLGWMPVLLVVTAVTAAFVLPLTGAAVVVVAQSAVVGMASALAGLPVTDGILGMVVYGCLQVFGVVMVHGTQREAQARRRLADVNADLQATTALLAESSRTAERLRIARELHDLVGHQLTALALELEVASHRATPPASEHVTRARRIAKDLLTDVRAAVGELRVTMPPLRSALERLTAELPRPRVHLAVDDAADLDGERTTALVRCVQEIVTNAVRHADADNLWIEIAAGADGRLTLRAHDDGRGAGRLQLGHGLTGMRERIEQLGGAVSFDQGPGFEVVAQVPAA